MKHTLFLATFLVAVLFATKAEAQTPSLPNMENLGPGKIVGDLNTSQEERELSAFLKNCVRKDTVAIITSNSRSSYKEANDFKVQVEEKTDTSKMSKFTSGKEVKLFGISVKEIQVQTKIITFDGSLIFLVLNWDEEDKTFTTRGESKTFSPAELRAIRKLLVALTD
jgi:hypothetical protein